MMDKQKYLLLNESIRQNAIAAIRNTPLDFKSPKEVIIQEPKRSLPQNARLHAMLSDVSRQATYMGKKRGIEFWKGLFVSGWQIATNQKPEIVPGLEGEFINIRESTTRLTVKKLTEVMDYVEAYCGMNGIKLSDGGRYE
ncbi:recombination protein NinB [Yersinia kristensenii]|uniref:recombination protein NinB n=2 Tax=Yersiniaceae TaxID=1903411 RepID=UPI0009093BE2|nr:recombination protein NinB [Yersinia kristensenii]